MIELFFIGTLHLKFTPHQELREEIEKISPQIIGVEITQEDINNYSVKNYPDEMQYALQYAKNNSIDFFGFDSDINIFKEKDNVEKLEEDLINKQKEVISKYNWKQFNNKKYSNLLAFDVEKELINDKKFLEREKEMAQNIENYISDTSNLRVLIITGCGHLDFFEQKFKQASFPLRII